MPNQSRRGAFDVDSSSKRGDHVPDHLGSRTSRSYKVSDSSAGAALLDLLLARNAKGRPRNGLQTHGRNLLLARLAHTELAALHPVQGGLNKRESLTFSPVVSQRHELLV